MFAFQHRFDFENYARRGKKKWLRKGDAPTYDIWSWTGDSAAGAGSVLPWNHRDGAATSVDAVWTGYV